VEFGSRSLVDAVCAFRRGCPEVFFDVALGHPDTLLPRLAAGELDLVFADMFSGGGRGMKLPQFTVSPVVTEKLVLVCSACYFAARLAAGRGPAVISGCDFVDYSHGHPALDNWFRHHYNKTFPGLKVVLAVESVQAVLSAVKGGLGLGIIPEYLVRGELRDGSLKAVRTGKPELINCISLVRLKGRAASPAEKAFLESFRRAL
jgi:DNA-binding transcriptional LysR family regulator